MTTQFQILLSRLLTRFGDQAWDFAVPLTLLKIFPDQIRFAAIYFLIVKFLHVIFMPKLATIIDRKTRLYVAYTGTFMQLVGVIGGTISLISLSGLVNMELFWGLGPPLMFFIILIISGLISSLGSSLMNISVGNDLVPAALSKNEIPKFNSRLRQLDLFTEVTAPVLAGILLIITIPEIPLLGFLLVAVWNIISFFPELLILRSIFKSHPELLNEKTNLTNLNRKSLLTTLTSGWTSFFRQPVAIAVAAYALLWLSVLSPHGVLLTGFLKDGLKMPEITIGVFRGLGALFGIAATFIFPIVISKYGLIKGSRHFIVFQTIMLIMALGCFFMPTTSGQYGFLVFILFSRIGLYGFSLGELQIRQLGIAPHERGEVNGFADALTGVATLVLFGFGSLLPATGNFVILIIGSVVFVGLGAAIFSAWKPRKAFH